MFRIQMVTSNQSGPHPNLERVVRRHLGAPYLRLPAAPTREAFASLNPPPDRPWLLDGGCGSGESSVWLAQQFPDHWVLGIDKSVSRLEQADRLHGALPENLTLLRADLVDFCLLAVQAGMRFAGTTLFYPNPWPKSEHLQRRWHGHAIFPLLLRLSQQIELRSNWELYMQEFDLALGYAVGRRPGYVLFVPDPPVSVFERKYMQAGQALFKLRIAAGPGQTLLAAPHG